MCRNLKQQMFVLSRQAGGGGQAAVELPSEKMQYQDFGQPYCYAMLLRIRTIWREVGQNSVCVHARACAWTKHKIFVTPDAWVKPHPKPDPCTYQVYNPMLFIFCWSALSPLSKRLLSHWLQHSASKLATLQAGSYHLLCSSPTLSQTLPSQFWSFQETV